MTYFTEHCPHCHSSYGFSLGGFGSGLGSREYVCATCQEVFRSDRQEWAEMRSGGRQWYVLISVAYIVVVGFLGGIISWSAWYIAFPPKPQDGSWSTSPLFWVCAVIAGSFVIWLQVYRLKLSRLRSADLEKPRLVAKFFSWQVNLQLYILASLVILPSIAEIIRWLMREPD